MKIINMVKIASGGMLKDFSGIDLLLFHCPGHF